MLPSASTPAVVDVYHMDMRDRLPMHKATYHIESTPSEVYAGFFVAVKDEKEKPDPFYIIRLMKLRQDAYDFLKWSRKGNSWVEDETGSPRVESRIFHGYTGAENFLRRMQPD